MPRPTLSPRSPRLSPPVQVRPFTLNDAPEVLALIERNRSRFRENGLNLLPQTVHDLDAWTQDTAPHGERVLGVFEQARCVGFVGVLTVRVGTMTVPGVGVWYGLDHACEGRGLATEGVRRALRGYVERLGPNAPDLVMVHCRIANRRSARLAQRLGMQRNPDLDYVRYDGGRSAPRMLAFSMPTPRVLALDWFVETSAEPNSTTSPRARAKRHG